MGGPLAPALISAGRMAGAGRGRDNKHGVILGHEAMACVIRMTKHTSQVRIYGTSIRWEDTIAVHDGIYGNTVLGS
jgi:hypothetical protein